MTPEPTVSPPAFLYFLLQSRTAMAAAGVAAPATRPRAFKTMLSKEET